MTGAFSFGCGNCATAHFNRNVIQFADGPTLYAKHPCFALPAASGSKGFGVAGPKGGTAEIDNLTLWSIKPDEQPTWNVRRAALPKFEPMKVKEEKAKPEKKPKAKAN